MMLTYRASASRRRTMSRRSVLQAAGVAAAAAPLAAVGHRVLAAPPAAGLLPADLASPYICRTATTAAAGGARTAIKIAWNASAVCLSPVAVAVERGIFASYGIDAELFNFGASTEALLEAIATGKADAGVGMALRWLKPMEQGFDVKITAGTHGGCMRLLAPHGGAIGDLAGLKGRTVGVSDMASPAKNFFSIMLQKRGIDPMVDVEWRQYPAELLPLAIEKGEIDALAEGDPRTFMWLKDGKLTEVASNLSDEYRDRVCCVLGLRGSLVRDNPEAAAAITRAVLEAQHRAAQQPEEAAEVYAPHAKASKEDLVAMLNSQTHAHSPVGGDLKREIALYAEELKLVGVFKARTDPAKFADKVYADVLSV